MWLLINRIKSYYSDFFTEIQIYILHYWGKLNLVISKKKVKKIQLGSGKVALDGFENTDVVNSIIIDRIVDLRRRFPYADNSVEIIFSEHVFEHFSTLELEKIFVECVRVLNANGELLFSIPDFQLVMESFFFKKNPTIIKKYKQDLERFNIDFYDSKFQELEDIFYFDHLIHQFGEHKFFYTYNVLCFLLKKAGFTKIKKRKPDFKIDSKERCSYSLYISASFK